MYIFNKPELVHYPEFQQAIILSELTTGAEWKSLYRDKMGELCITFADKLSEEQIKTILMHFKDLIDGDTDVDSISVKERIDYEYDFSVYDISKKLTRIYTPDGYDYSQF